MDDLQQKEELRQKFIAVRLGISDEEVISKSQLIADKLEISVNWPDIKNVHIYRSVPEWKEVDTKIIEDKIKSCAPSSKIVYASIEKNQPLPQEQFDLIIIPVLGFDKQCYRLGLGGGWYDRFLVHQRDALKIGLAWQDCFVPEGLPHETHDIVLDKIITETGIIDR